MANSVKVRSKLLWIACLGGLPRGVSRGGVDKKTDKTPLALLDDGYKPPWSEGLLLAKHIHDVACSLAYSDIGNQPTSH